jgi:hypothetical protein
MNSSFEKLTFKEITLRIIYFLVNYYNLNQKIFITIGYFNSSNIFN